MVAAADSVTLEPVTIIGDQEEARVLPGSGAVVDQEQLDKEAATDVHQVLKTVPGVYVREEDGAGLRPNIGIRGATAERSSKVTLMEDGVLIAPAPYSNPAAYYFPTTMRISSIEVLKGAPLLRHGPQTTGGVINMLSTPLPTGERTYTEFVTDERGSTDLHAHHGDAVGDWAWMVETVQRDGAGFKDIDRSNRDSGFDIQDYVGKVRWQGDRQSVQFKMQYSEEISNETYLGLTDSDFDDEPNRRYGLSSIDQMDNKHYGLNLTHVFEWSDTVQSTATLYRNDFERNWFKLDGGGSLVDAANGGDANAQGILDGDVDTTGLEYKNNNRAYVSEGIQVNFDIDLGAHQLETGVRFHEDEMDRFQPVDVYDQVNGSLVFQSTNAPTGGNNRFETGEARSLWLIDKWQATDELKVNLALRHEDVETSRVQYADPGRDTVDEKRSNDSDEWLPGASFTYDVSDSWQVLAGVHRGFAPLGGGAKKSEEPETSDNWEFGGRYFGHNLFVEAIGFYSDFSNKTENCSVGSPCSDGSTSGTFVTGEAEISGVEFQLGTGFDRGDFYVPVDLTYTYTNAEASEDNATSGFEKGDQLKDIPENQFSVRAGLEHVSGWDNYAVIKYIDEMCVSAGCNRTSTDLDETESLMVVDFISRYQLRSQTQAFLKVENLFDEQRIVSRLPDGARPNKPLTVSVGMRHEF
ncbi:MAG: TonB-dependent receptor [Halofilum sp. (in: g-proteobacteria)]|nr:TonB-dependent receptor [Halofilum sp. (in: g-proteobacteria)]